VLALAGRAAGVLKERGGIANARLEAELLLAAVLGLRRLDLYLQFDRPVRTDELDRYRTLVRRRLRHEPLQYIVGETGFRRLVLHVDRRVLIPRPETETLVGEVLGWAVSRNAETALDLGTGSGAIALSLAQEGRWSRIVATDLSADALDVARLNAARHGLTDRVEFRHGDGWQAVLPGERFDVIVSNPPYVSESDRESLAPEVADWEPASALFAAEGGLSMLETLVSGAAVRLNTGGMLALEVGLGQAEWVARRAREHGSYTDVRVVRDLTGRDRVVLAGVP